MLDAMSDDDTCKEEAVKLMKSRQAQAPASSTKRLLESA